MRIRRSVSQVFAVSVIPAIAIAITAYFGYYTVAGPRGLLALGEVSRQLSIEQSRLATLQADNGRLKHRIDLLKPGHADPDLIEEIVRDQMIDSAPGEIAVPRKGHEAGP